ncbi:hypothetical protein [Eupransor demetentiae]|uniref:Uncharacterized protein n=1 Tax=Eupransor demetentiae TaxID=3109584 RepID=A0ABP0ETF3_9LACO|nr:hypothetical protein R54876_GBNLAHCA_00979 [Lactobacillaceae bacterium LMG 33000]
MEKLKNKLSDWLPVIISCFIAVVGALIIIHVGDKANTADWLVLVEVLVFCMVEGGIVGAISTLISKSKNKK